MTKESNSRVALICSRCSQAILEHYTELTPYHNSIVSHWVQEVHELPDCVRYLNKRLRDLEERINGRF